MTFRKIASALACLVATFMVGCTDTSPTSTDTSVTLTPEAGQFGMSWLRGLGKAGTAADTGAVRTGAQVNFDLGEIKGSSSFYFLLYNIGRRPITNVTLSVDDTNFAVYPVRMDTLIPGGDVGMLPVIKVSAYHGTPLDGVGNRPCLPMGTNLATLTISGVTKTFRGVDTAVIVTARMELSALVMSIDLRIGCTPVDLERPPMWALGIHMLNSTVGNTAPIYGMYDAGTSVTPGNWVMLSNNGNVPILLSVFYMESLTQGTVGPVSDTVAIGDSVFVARQGGPDLVFCLDGNHAVGRSSALQPQSDGRTYFNVSGNGNVDSNNSCPPSASSAKLNVFAPASP